MSFGVDFKVYTINTEKLGRKHVGSVVMINYVYTGTILPRKPTTQEPSNYRLLCLN